MPLRRPLMELILNPNPPRWADDRIIRNVLACILIPAIIMCIATRPGVFGSRMLLVVIGSSLLVLLLLWPLALVRESQRRFYRSIIKDYDATCCPWCRYARQGWASSVCPECGRDADAIYEEATRVLGPHNRLKP